jgi:hypothetical protein
MAEESKKAPAVYLPFKTFMSSLDSLEQGLPKRLDRTVWRSQSGIVQGQIMMALRFFGLLTDTDEPTAALHRLVEAPDRRKEHISALLLHSYHDILEADLTKMSPRMLEELMGQYNVSGDTRRKAVAFFLRAAKYVELPMHPLLMAQIRETSGKRKRRAAAPAARENGNGAAQIRTAAEDGLRSTRTISLRGGGTVSLTITADPFSLDTTDREFLFDLVDKIQGYKPDAPEEQEDE